VVLYLHIRKKYTLLNSPVSKRDNLQGLRVNKKNRIIYKIDFEEIVWGRGMDLSGTEYGGVVVPCKSGNEYTDRCIARKFLTRALLRGFGCCPENINPLTPNDL
jgi:hypothetical protein